MIATAKRPLNAHSFSDLPEQARVWIYPSSSVSARKNPYFLQTRYIFIPIDSHPWYTPTLTYDLPITTFVIGLDEEVHGASGCSIYASVHLIQGIEQAFDLILLDKMNVCYRVDSQIVYTPLKAFESWLKLQKSIKTPSFSII